MLGNHVPQGSASSASFRRRPSWRPSRSRSLSRAADGRDAARPRESAPRVPHRVRNSSSRPVHRRPQRPLSCCTLRALQSHTPKHTSFVPARAGFSRSCPPRICAPSWP
eukprot:43236-Prymnesium_polylepis.2